MSYKKMAKYVVLLEHLQEFPKSSPNPWFLERWEKTPLQQLLIYHPNLYDLGKTLPIHVTLRAEDLARIVASRVVSVLARCFGAALPLRAEAEGRRRRLLECSWSLVSSCGGGSPSMATCCCYLMASNLLMPTGSWCRPTWNYRWL